MERGALSLSQSEHVEQIVSTSEEEKKENRELMKKLLRSLYSSLSPHTTTYDSLTSLQIDNENVKLQMHRDTCPQNATYESCKNS